MITFTFNGAVNDENVRVYDRLFHGGQFMIFFYEFDQRHLRYHKRKYLLAGERLNPNGCTAKATYFVSHKYTNYSAVQELHRKGHEIGVFSITNEDDPKYWTEGNYDSWLAEMAGSRSVFERFPVILDFSMQADY